jgi:hypothetical protein
MFYLCRMVPCLGSKTFGTHRLDTIASFDSKQIVTGYRQKTSYTNQKI